MSTTDTHTDIHTHAHTHRHTHDSKLSSTDGMCTSDFAALCWVMPRPVPQNSSFASNNSLLVHTQLADPWAGQADVTATKQRPVSVSLATPFLIFQRNGELEDRVTSQWQGRLLKVLSDSVCEGVESVKNWEWMLGDVTFGRPHPSRVHGKVWFSFPRTSSSPPVASWDTKALSYYFWCVSSSLEAFIADFRTFEKKNVSCLTMWWLWLRELWWFKYIKVQWRGTRYSLGKWMTLTKHL